MAKQSDKGTAKAKRSTSGAGKKRAASGGRSASSTSSTKGAGRGRASKTRKDSPRLAKVNEKAQAPATGLPKAWREGLGVALIAIALLVAAGVYSHQFGSGRLMGQVGALLGYALYSSFGMMAYMLALGIFVAGIKFAVGKDMELRFLEAAGFVLATLSACLLLSTLFPEYRLVDSQGPGGLCGEVLAVLSKKAFGTAGTYLVGSAALCLGLLISTPLELMHLARPFLWISEVVQETLGTSFSALWAKGRSGGWRDAAAEDWDRQESPLPEDKPARRAPSSARKKKPLREEENAASDIGEGISWIDEEDEEGEEEAPASGAAASPGKGRLARKNRKKGGASGTRSRALKSASAEDSPSGPKSAAKAAGALPASGDASTRVNSQAATENLEIVVMDESLDVKPPDEDSPAAPRSGEDKAAPKKKTPEAKASAPAEAPAAPKPKGGGTHPVQYLCDRYELPPLELFGAAHEKRSVEYDEQFLRQQARQIVESLAHFRIGGSITKVHPGPVITRYEFKPEAGVKLSKIESLENDLAMALEAIRIRILAPIPGTSCVGFEVPNKDREIVYVQEIMGDPAFISSKARLPLVLGKNITGKPVFIDLAKAPHLLVAGATGSGKSVGVNSMLCSLLHACTPEELRLILIDPKMLEFSIYGGIPHLLLPVITEADRANLALRWVVKEMERRYKVLSEAKVRDISGYNKKLPQLQEHWEAEKRALEREAELAAEAVREEGEEAVPGASLSGVCFDKNGQAQISYGGKALEERPESMPYIVVVIDEFADLMMVASKEVEANVARIAAKARAAGIHLIVATQRPSVDVITGTIKNNFPSRIAFQVTSDVDSRTILDQKGAKQLLGMGDMLYMDRGKEPARVHGCFVSENEIEKVVDFVSKQARPAYNLEITTATEDGGAEEEQSLDPLYDKAVQIVAEAQKVSTSMIQRRLNVGYNRAAKIVEAMEAQGVIGAPRGSQGREVFISPHN